MTIIEILSILLIHWIADFVLQTDKQAKGKSKNWSDLLSHTAIYSLFWTVPISIFSLFGYDSSDFGWSPVLLLFIPITFVFHTITDYFTSRLNSKLWAEGKVHYFFVSIGFDQWLHYAQLFITYQLLK